MTVRAKRQRDGADRHRHRAMTIRPGPELAGWITRLARAEGRPRSAVIIDLLEEAAAARGALRPAGASP